MKTNIQLQPQPNTRYTLPSGNVVIVNNVGKSVVECTYARLDGGANFTMEFFMNYAKPQRHSGVQ